MAMKSIPDGKSKVTLCKFDQRTNKLNIIETMVGGPKQPLQYWTTPKPHGKGWVLLERYALSLYPKHLKALQEQYPEIYQELIGQFIETEIEDIPAPKVKRKGGRPKGSKNKPKGVKVVEVE